MKKIGSVLSLSLSFISLFPPRSFCDPSAAIRQIAKELKPAYAQAYRDRAKKKLIEYGPDAIPTLGEILEQNEELDVSFAILEIFEAIQDPKSVPYVLAFMDEQDSTDLIAQSIKTLGATRSSATIPKLTQILKEAPETYFFEQDMYKVVAITLLTLKEIGDPAAVDAILEFAKTNPQPYCAQALGALGDDRALPFLIDWLKFDDREVRLSAAESLSKFLRPTMSKFLWTALLSKVYLQSMNPCSPAKVFL